MSNTSAYMPWYIGDYLRDTMHLEAHEHGAYLMLIAHAWQHDGAIPLDHEIIRKIGKLSREQWASSEPTIMAFWRQNGTAYRQKRIDAELPLAIAKYQQKVDAGKARAAQRTLSERSADEQRTLSQSESPSPSELPSTSKPPKVNPTAQNADAFARFWGAYPKKRSKGDAQKAFKAIKADPELLERILGALAEAKESEQWRKDGGQFIPYPGTWLRAQGWHDQQTKAVSRVPCNWPWCKANGDTEHGTVHVCAEHLEALQRGETPVGGWQ